MESVKKTSTHKVNFVSACVKWAQLGLNQWPPDYESGATNQLSYGPPFLNFESANVLLFLRFLKILWEKFILD